MKFIEFAKYLEKLEATSKRLEITEILAELISKLTVNEIDKAIYLSLGYLKAPFENKRFNIADKIMQRSLEIAYEIDAKSLKDKYGVSGDLGDVVSVLAAGNAISNYNIVHIYTKLYDIAGLEGMGSQDLKIETLANLLKELDAIEAKYVVRIVLGTTRLGFTELTIIDALAKGVAIKEKIEDKNDIKSLKSLIEYKYNIHPDIGKIASKLLENGIDGLKDLDIEVGVPINAQKAQRLGTFDEIMTKLGTVWAEYKFDGTRVQLHMNRSVTTEKSALEQKNLFGENTQRILIKTFTRNLEETTYQFPDIVEACEKYIDAESVILDGEAIGYDRDTMEFLPFQEIMQRKRKHDVQEMAKQIPLKYFAFDILYLNGKPLTNLPLRERKEILKSVVKKGDLIVVDEYTEVSNVAELTKYFEDAREKGLEGLILKKPDGIYEAGARSFNWVKVKVADTKLLDDSVDCVVLGYYFGKGTRAQYGIGGFLVGVYDKDTDTYKSITKVGTGLKEADWLKLKEMADKVAVLEKPQNVEVNNIYAASIWLKPQIVVELGADEISKSTTHSCGYALRFPRLLKFRTDKGPLETTSVEEIADLHNMQKRGYY